jgi:hypothetical protein
LRFEFSNREEVNIVRFNYSKLLGRIVERYGTRGRFAAAMDLSDSVMSSRLTQDTYFSMEEIIRAVDLLGIAVDEIGLYFFTLAVREIELQEEGT